MKRVVKYIIILLLFAAVSYAQTAVEVYIIDSYVTPEKPHKFVLSFFTTGKATSEVTIDGEYDFVVSDEFKEDHKIEIDLSPLRFDSTAVSYFITGETASGEKYKSDIYKIKLPDNNNLLTGEKNTSLLTVCCFGGIIFGLPAPTFVAAKDQNYFGLSKEIPVLSFYSGGYNYPVGYLSVEYSYIFKAERKNYMRAGYKHIFQVPAIEYLSLGVNGFTDFEGFNGVSPEFSVGFLKIYNVFTLYARYRYNFQPSYSDRNFHEISIGLYSNFFSVNL